MEKRLKTILLLTLSALLCCGAGCADSGGLAISGKASTLGLGGELTTAVTSNVNARVGINAFNVDFEDKAKEVEYDVGLDLYSFSALLDWHIFNSSFRVSGGVLVNQNELSLYAKPANSVIIGEDEYEPEQIGTLTGGVDFEDIAPYVGIGWGNALDSSKRWGFTCDFGVAYTRSPRISLSADGLLADDPGFQADLAREKGDIEDKLRPFKFYPVISLSLFYRF